MEETHCRFRQLSSQRGNFSPNVYEGFVMPFKAADPKLHVLGVFKTMDNAIWKEILQIGRIKDLHQNAPYGGSGRDD